MNPALASIERAMARAEMHNDPIRDVLESQRYFCVNLDNALAEMRHLFEAARNPVDIDRLARCAALGANEQALALVRTMEARNRWLRIAIAAGCVALGFVMGKLG